MLDFNTAFEKQLQGNPEGTDNLLVYFLNLQEMKDTGAVIEVQKFAIQVSLPPAERFAEIEKHWEVIDLPSAEVPLPLLRKK